ncbi:hypothetical protein B296_00011410, partial [Ensete ventricosum]
QSRFGRCCRELAKSSLEVSRGSDDVVGSSLENSPKVYREVCREFTNRLPELAESSPEECWKFIGSSLKEIGSSPGVHRKDTGSLPKRQSNNEDYMLCVVVSIVMRVSFTNSIKRSLGLNWG